MSLVVSCQEALIAVSPPEELTSYQVPAVNELCPVPTPPTLVIVPVAVSDIASFAIPHQR